MDLIKNKPAPALNSVPPSFFVVPVTPGIKANPTNLLPCYRLYSCYYNKKADIKFAQLFLSMQS